MARRTFLGMDRFHKCMGQDEPRLTHGMHTQFAMNCHGKACMFGSRAFFGKMAAPRHGAVQRVWQIRGIIHTPYRREDSHPSVHFDLLTVFCAVAKHILDKMSGRTFFGMPDFYKRMGHDALPLRAANEHNLRNAMSWKLMYVCQPCSFWKQMAVPRSGAVQLVWKKPK